MKKNLAILVALLLLAGAVFFIVRFAPSTPELSLTFVGFETNGAAKFVVSNHSSRKIVYFGPADGPFGLSFGSSGVPRSVEPGEQRDEWLWRSEQKSPWRAVLYYRRQPRPTDKLRHWLWQRHVRFVERPDMITTVASAPITSR